MDNKENIKLEKKLNYLSIVLSIVVLSLVVLMRRYKFDVGIDFSFLPPFHAILNTLACLSLIAAFYFIKNKNIVAHKRSIYVAMILSALFLLCYVVYHFTTVETNYCKEGNIRVIYFILLITHVVLAGGILPFILLTFNRAYTLQYDRHKKMARWVFPLWLYVAATGPICYLMLKDCYQ